MKVLLVQSHLGRIKSNIPLFPIGLCYIATSLKKHDVKILDLNLWEVPLAFSKLQKNLLDFGPDVVGISLRNIDSTQRFDKFYYFKTVQPTVQLIKKNDPNIIVLAGGSGFSLFNIKIMQLVEGIDFGIYLEGEESTPELLDNLNNPYKVKGIYIRNNDGIHYTGDRTLPRFERIPMPERGKELVDIHQYFSDGPNYTIGLQSKRGCLLNCGYCSYPFLTGRKLRLRKAEDVVDEIEYLIGLGVGKFTFVDNIFNIPEKHATEICQEIIKRHINIEWSAWFEIKHTTEELVRLAGEAGCKSIGFSPDGASNKALSSMKKGITEADLERCLQIMKRVKGIQSGYSFFLMYPGMGIQDVWRTIFQYFRIPILLSGRGSALLNWVRIEPHTDIYDLAIREEHLDADKDLLPNEEKELDKLFYYKPSFIVIDYVMIHMTRVLEKYAKPVVKALLKLARLR